MSSGACRALVSLLLTLVATMVMALPVAAANDNLIERSAVTYTAFPETGKIQVQVVVRLTNNGRRVVSQLDDWGPVIVEQRATPSVNTGAGFGLGDRSAAAGPWELVRVKTPRIEADGGSERLILRYTLDASIGQSGTPARVDRAYVYFCVPGVDSDSGSVVAQIQGGSGFRITQTGTTMEPTSDGLRTQRSTTLAEHFTCLEATRDDRLESRVFIGPAGREITLQAWRGHRAWLDAAEAQAEGALDEIHRFLGHDIPGDDPVIVREAPPRSVGGYASAHDTPGIVQLDETAGVRGAEHELAHAWFGTDNFTELWLREGLALWTATAMSGSVCPPAPGGVTGLDLSDWKVVEPTSDPDTIDDEIAAQEAAACGIVSAVAARMPEEQWRVVLGSMLEGQTKYIGSDGPGRASSDSVDYREWLDAVDERGLVPAARAAGADPAHALNLEELDFAQDLLADYGVPLDALELIERSQARAAYHEFLERAAPLGAPLAVREAMDNWEFDRAMEMLDKSDEVLTALTDANRMLPGAGIIPLIQGPFESARNVVALDRVALDADELRRSVRGVTEPLGELIAAAPEGWDLPAAVNDAQTERRFGDILDAIRPALRVVQDVTAADAALPQAGLLDTYRDQYETAATKDKLEDLADEVAKERTLAERTGRALGLLGNEVGEWTIPAAVTDPIDNGQLATGLTIVEDALAVVRAAGAADEALPQAGVAADVRPRFERVEDAGQMAALKSVVEEQRDQAIAVGDALHSLETLVPDWQVPALITAPIEAREFATAATVATAAQKWIVNAAEANKKLAEMDAINRTRARFESAETLADLEDGAALAESWNIAAGRVAAARDAYEKPRDMLESLGLWGVDVKPTLDEAFDAAIDGRVDEAFNKSAEVIDTLGSGGSSGSLRLAGLVFFGVAVLGVLGLWVILRRQAGPPWARQSRPHWIEPRKSGSPPWRRDKKS